MIRCVKCNSKMVEVNVIDLNEHNHRALVCTYCGRLYSKDIVFKKDVMINNGKIKTAL